MITVLAVDDEPALLQTLRTALMAHGYHVLTATEGHNAIASMARSRPDVVVLDLGLPDMGGLAVIRSLRARSQVPIIVLSGRRETTEKIHALDAGADDYLTKPFDVDELLARIRASTRAVARDDVPAPVIIGDHLVDLHTHSVSSTTHDQSPENIDLTATEWLLLERLVSRPGQLVRHDHLLQAISEPSTRGDTAHLRRYMAQIRRKLEPDPARPRFLLTELGIGYRFRPGH